MVEGGLGPGALAMSMLRAIGPQGQLVTYEINDAAIKLVPVILGFSCEVLIILSSSRIYMRGLKKQMSISGIRCTSGMLYRTQLIHL